MLDLRVLAARRSCPSSPVPSLLTPVPQRSTLRHGVGRAEGAARAAAAAVDFQAQRRDQLQRALYAAVPDPHATRPHPLRSVPESASAVSLESSIRCMSADEAGENMLVATAGGGPTYLFNLAYARVSRAIQAVTSIWGSRLDRFRALAWPWPPGRNVGRVGCPARGRCGELTASRCPPTACPPSGSDAVGHA
jgi:hypothetical protein